MLQMQSSPTLHSQELLLCGPTRVHLWGRLWGRGGKRLEQEGGKAGGRHTDKHWTTEDIKTNFSLTWGEIIYLEEAGWRQRVNERRKCWRETLEKNSSDDNQCTQLNMAWQKYCSKMWLTSAGLWLFTPSLRLCFKMLLFCLMDWTWESRRENDERWCKGNTFFLAANSEAFKQNLLDQVQIQTITLLNFTLNIHNC